ncbi:MAG: hypothetical protein Q9O62_02365 [Ardenticatenia bacterium]|nr:hypothetical protein [Ardenticatenia bacterium]
MIKGRAGLIWALIAGITLSSIWLGVTMVAAQGPTSSRPTPTTMPGAPQVNGAQPALEQPDLVIKSINVLPPHSLREPELHHRSHHCQPRQRRRARRQQLLRGLVH